MNGAPHLAAFQTLAEAEQYLQLQGFRLMPGHRRLAQRGRRRWRRLRDPWRPLRHAEGFSRRDTASAVRALEEAS
jgi:hypothetical protein